MGWDGMGRDWMVLFCNQKWNRSRKRSDTHPSEIERYETRPGVPGWRSCKLRKADRVGSRWISWGDGWTWVSFCWHLVISQWFGWCISRQRMECEYDCEKNTHKILDVFVTLTWAYTNKETTPKSKSNLINYVTSGTTSWESWNIIGLAYYCPPPPPTRTHPQHKRSSRQLLH